MQYFYKKKLNTFTLLVQYLKIPPQNTPDPLDILDIIDLVGNIDID